MPGFDGTGPRGIGPMTGRGLGYCVMPLGEGSAYGAPLMHYAGRTSMPGRGFGIWPYGATRGTYFGCGRRWRSGGRISGRFGRRRGW